MILLHFFSLKSVEVCPCPCPIFNLHFRPFLLLFHDPRVFLLFYSQSFFGFGPTAEIEIVVKDADKRPIVNMKTEENELVPLPLYTGTDPIVGTMHIKVPKGKKIEHMGVKIELVGQIGTYLTAG